MRLKIREFFSECGRIIKIARKPEMKEVNEIFKICLIGILVIGLMGFSIQGLLFIFTTLTGSVEAAILPTFALGIAFLYLLFKFLKY
ncbi:MAG: protein translocase SEC61 complex subunit gamma [Candidatus Nanoarchaeia archaeon]|nr:protein translocase SEC61 complex subunit gamma [Candidatus Haiyanarchaeum thermophilum]MCW1303270.1 protein translocase SEC61 complex subunit gamma [Candidatus Haiyanarchaeum thermophilum]MCW1303999.1 protein translocase SEC61 complex subunit gamma [Candidatus Haiyanarchaeum thermophilum]MCW1306429.1 protein translocase SEC61 complex subunit gamma [Candidatus Haiyanarchaeum thermophilum]MCW1307273.1 protein translocase SEC61 complex subunit gamma [Candidatus Haiyanarchaeum thermophilum]